MQPAAVEIAMAAFEILAWMVLGAALSFATPGARNARLLIGMTGAMMRGFVARELDWNVLLGSFSLSVLLIAGIGAEMAIWFDVLLARRANVT
jgi:hypothetical protein